MSEVEIIRELCREIAEEQDPEKTRLLLLDLREIIALASDETRLRLGFLVRFLRRIEKSENELRSTSSKWKIVEPAELEKGVNGQKAAKGNRAGEEDVKTKVKKSA